MPSDDCADSDERFSDIFSDRWHCLSALWYGGQQKSGQGDRSRRQLQQGEGNAVHSFFVNPLSYYGEGGGLVYMRLAAALCGLWLLRLCQTAPTALCSFILLHCFLPQYWCSGGMIRWWCPSSSIWWCWRCSAAAACLPGRRWLNCAAATARPALKKAVRYPPGVTQV